MERKLKLFGLICRMDDNRLVKNVVFGIMDGQNRRGRLSREWIDDIKKWCRADIYTHPASWRRTDWNGNELSLRHWTPTGASP